MAAPQEPCCGASGAPVAPAVDDLLPLLKALADPVRLQIVARLAEADDSVCACSMPEAFGVSQPTMSHHLKKLVDAGVLEKEMRGNWAHFTLRTGGVDALRHFLAQVARPSRR